MFKNNEVEFWKYEGGFTDPFIFLMVMFWPDPLVPFAILQYMIALIILF